MRTKTIFILVIMCFSIIPAIAQLKHQVQSNYEIIRSSSNLADLKSKLNFRSRVIDFHAVDIEKKAQLVNLTFDSQLGFIRLDDTQLIEDDAPATGFPEGFKDYTHGPVEWVEDLRKGIVIKKVLVLENTVNSSARLVFNGMEVLGNKEPLHLSLNGEKFIRPASALAYPNASQYISFSAIDRWYYIDIPTQKLRIGKNEILMWTESDPMQTPVIRGLLISTVREDLSVNKESGLQVNVLNNGKIIQPSYPFAYERLNHLELKKYREDHKLDQVVKGAKSEFEVMKRLLNWAYRVPLTSNAYSWNWNDVTKTPQIDESTGMPKLNGPFKGLRMIEMCLYPNQALVGALLSMGYQARHINIHSEGMSGHEVTEVWSNEFNKWIYMDSTRDYYYFDPETGIPFNLLEIHKLIATEMPRVETWESPFAPEIGKELVKKLNVGQRQGNNPFSIHSGGVRVKNSGNGICMLV